MRKVLGGVIGLALLAFFWTLAWKSSDEASLKAIVAAIVLFCCGIGGGVVAFMTIGFPERLGKTESGPSADVDFPSPPSRAGRIGRLLGRLVAIALILFGLDAGLELLRGGMKAGSEDHMLIGAAILAVCVGAGAALWRCKARLASRCRPNPERVDA